jgi:hypothetical protein
MCGLQAFSKRHTAGFRGTSVTVSVDDLTAAMTKEVKVAEQSIDLPTREQPGSGGERGIATWPLSRTCPSERLFRSLSRPRN